MQGRHALRPRSLLLGHSSGPCRCRVVAPDLRAHGQTQALDGADFSAATLAADVVALWQRMFGSQASGGGCADAASSAPRLEQQGQQAQQQEQPGGAQHPPTVLVGHSMGGAIAVHAAALGGERQGAWGQCASLLPATHQWQRVWPGRPTTPFSCFLVLFVSVSSSWFHVAFITRSFRGRHCPALPAGISILAGVVVIDVVEGTAIASLPYMTTVLQVSPSTCTAAGVVGCAPLLWPGCALSWLCLLAAGCCSQQRADRQAAGPRCFIPQPARQRACCLHHPPLQKRPKHFASLQHAVDWALDTGGLLLGSLCCALRLLHLARRLLAGSLWLRRAAGAVVVLRRPAPPVLQP